MVQTHGRASLHEIYGYKVDYGDSGKSLIYCAPPELAFSHRRDTLQMDAALRLLKSRSDYLFVT